MAQKKWGGGVGFQPFYPGASPGEPKALKPWKLSDNYLDNNDEFPQLVLLEDDFITLKEGLERSVHQQKKIPALLDGLRRKPADSVFNPPMVIFSNGFTKFAYCRQKVFFQDSLRSITGSERDADLLRFLTAVLGSRLMQYQAFHSGSSNGIGRDKLHFYESLNMPFPLPDHELTPSNSEEIVREAASILKEVEQSGRSATRQGDFAADTWAKLEPLVEEYFSVTEYEKILIEDTLALSQPSIHRSSLAADVPSLAFPEFSDRKRYADTLCDLLNRRARKRGITIQAEGMVSKPLNLIFLTIIFAAKVSRTTKSEGRRSFGKHLSE